MVSDQQYDRVVSHSFVLHRRQQSSDLRVHVRRGRVVALADQAAEGGVYGTVWEAQVEGHNVVTTPDVRPGVPCDVREVEWVVAGLQIIIFARE